jgi:putative oxidoreductase
MSVVTANTTSTETNAIAKAQSTTLSAADFGLLAVRLALAVVFMAHGGQKLFGWFGGPGLSGAVQFMGSMGIPAFFAYLAVFTEFFGGLALLVGLFSRLASLGLFITMIVATVKVHLANGFFLSGPDGKTGFEYNLVLLLISLAVILTGPGRLAVGDWETALLRRLRK